MSLNVNGVGLNRIGAVGSTGQVTGVQNNTKLLQQDAPVDTVSFKGNALTDNEKKEMVLKARTSAAGWACFGGFISTMYYGLRSDKKVAEQYNLDMEKDKDLVKTIKKQQLLWTIPAAIPGAGNLIVIAPWVYNKFFAKPEDINLK